MVVVVGIYMCCIIGEVRYYITVLDREEEEEGNL